jgi:hypothetical protein
MLAKALPSALHFMSVLSLHANFPGSQTILVHLPSMSLQRPTLGHVLTADQLLPSGAHTSSIAPVQRWSVPARHIGQLPALKPAWQSFGELHACCGPGVPSALHTVNLPSLSQSVLPSLPRQTSAMATQLTAPLGPFARQTLAASQLVSDH